MPSFTFTDRDDGDQTFVAVRSNDDSVSLALSKQANGDLEVFMPREVALQLASALTEMSDETRQTKRASWLIFMFCLFVAASAIGFAVLVWLFFQNLA
jgi:hypothetical protein